MYTFVPALMGVFLLAGGWSMFRWSWAPIASLIFMYPLPDEATRYLLGPLQTVATIVSTYSLQTLGLDAYRDGNRIILGDGQVLGVVDACSGLKMLTIFVWLAVMLMLVAALFTLMLDSARQGFSLLMSIGAGTGLLYLLRWYWWRINAQAEIAAMAGSLLVAVGFEVARQAGHAVAPHLVILLTALVTTLIWVATALLTRPTDDATLVAFYRLVRPAGPGWTRIRALAGVGPSPDSLPQAMLGWVLGCGFVYCALFGTGALLYGRGTAAWVFGVTGLFCAWGVMRVLRGFKSVKDENTR
jgi:hypothetical protein